MSALAPRAKYPSAQFPTPGTRVQGVITQQPEDSQVKNFTTGDLEFWPDGNPIMQTKVVLRVADGTEVAIYVKGRMAKAVTQAIITSGEDDLEVGGVLAVTFTEYGTPKKGAQPPKLYGAEYTAPGPESSRDDDEPPF